VSIGVIFIKISLWQAIQLMILGYSYNNERYLIQCKKHGFKEAKPHGWKHELLCPECLMEYIMELRLRR
jgi:hypothetical protein